MLRAEARARDLRGRPSVKLDDLNADERRVWSAALDAYGGHARNNLVFDPVLVNINNALTMTSPDGALPPSVDAATKRALATAAPIYRAHYWAAQRELNDRWIAALQPMLAAHGETMIAALEAAYEIVWPRDRVIVDACAEGGPNGGYTTAGPSGTAAHTVIEAANPEYQGDMAFEMIFHEASHAAAIGGSLGAAIDAAAARQHVTAPRDLGHVVLFYTAGELARRALGKTGDAHYMPYAYRYDVYSRGWQSLRDAVVTDWQPHLDGKATLDAALDALVRDVREN